MTSSGNAACGTSPTGRAALGESGVTLAEIATTVSVLAVLLLAVVPVLSRLLDAYHLRGAAHQVYAELQRTRLAAVMQNNRYRFDVVSASEYVIHDDKNSDDENNGMDTVVRRSLEADSPGVTLAADNVITFTPNGAALSTGNITLTNRSGATKTVSVAAGGRIRLQ
jgi:Tfp pilus assembly protein FimT